MKQPITDKAFEAGFAAVGFTDASPLDELKNLKGAISEDRNASMGWLARNPEKRCDPKSLLPGAHSVICFALSYGDLGIGEGCRDEVLKARFSRGDEYHEAVRTRLEIVWDGVKKKFPNAKAKFCVDTSPILEKALAQRAGIGWIGKNTLLINESFGSWFVLGEIITDLKIEPDFPTKNKCGNCNACIDACPTKCIIEPGCLDANRCISYLTIESKDDLPKEFIEYIKVDQYGCDICQEVCPYNK